MVGDVKVGGSTLLQAFVSGDVSIRSILIISFMVPLLMLVAAGGYISMDAVGVGKDVATSEAINDAVNETRQYEYAITEELLLGLTLVNEGYSNAETISLLEKAVETSDGHYNSLIANPLLKSNLTTQALQKLYKDYSALRQLVLVQQKVESDALQTAAVALIRSFEMVRLELLEPAYGDRGGLLYQQLAVQFASQRLYTLTLQEGLVLETAIRNAKLEDKQVSKLTTLRDLADKHRRSIELFSNQMKKHADNANENVIGFEVALENVKKAFSAFDDTRRQVYANMLLQAQGDAAISVKEWRKTLASVLDNLKEVDKKTTLPALAVLTQQKEKARKLMLFAVASGMLVFLVMIITFFSLRSRVLVPIASITESMKQLADGNLLVELPALTYQDEVGSMINAVTVFKNNAVKVHEQTKILTMAETLAGLGSWRVNAKTMELWWSNEVYKIYGLNPKETALNMVLAVNMYHKDDRQQVIDAVENAIQNGTPFELESRLIRSDNQTRIVYSVAQVEKDAKGQVTSVFGTFQDITERKRAEEELRNHRDHLEEMVKEQTKDLVLAKVHADKARIEAEVANQAKSDFLANMSHELRTPLNSIIGMSELISESGITGENADMIETIRVSSGNLLEIVNDVLDISKIESGSLTLESIAFDLRECVRRTVDMLLPLASSRGLKASLKFEFEDALFVLGDPTRLARVVTNLVGNAIKYTEKGRVDVSIIMESVSTGFCKVHIAVKDTGIGIPEHKIGAIFEKFVQADTSTTRKYGGSGLGLSITRQLVEMMGGTIDVKSKVGEGSTFTASIIFPEADAQDVEEDFKDSSVPEGQGTILASELRLLVAEDHVLNQAFIKKLMPNFGIQHFEIVENGELALEAVKTEKFDMIFMDCHMPKMGGYDATEAIRAYEQQTGKHIPIIAMTANAMIGEREKCLKHGMDDYVSKPIDKVKLRKVMSRWVLFENGAANDSGGKSEKVMEGIPVLDTTVLSSFSEGDIETEREFAKLFFDQSALQIVKLSEYCVDGESIEWKEAAHLLKGGSATIGAMQMRTLCAEAQEMIRSSTKLRTQKLTQIQEAFNIAAEELKQRGLL